MPALFATVPDDVIRAMPLSAPDALDVCSSVHIGHFRKHAARSALAATAMNARHLLRRSRGDEGQDQAGKSQCAGNAHCAAVDLFGPVLLDLLAKRFHATPY